MDFLFVSLLISSVVSLSSKSLWLGLGSFGPRPLPAPSVWNHKRKTPEGKSIGGIWMQQNPPEKDQHVCFCKEADITLSVPIQHKQTKLSSGCQKNHNLIQYSQLKRRGGGAGHNWPPLAGNVWPHANCLTTFLSCSPKLTHVRPWPETPAPPWATYPPAQWAARLFQVTVAKVLGASGKRSAYHFAIEKFYFRRSWPG